MLSMKRKQHPDHGPDKDPAALGAAHSGNGASVSEDDVEYTNTKPNQKILKRDSDSDHHSTDSSDNAASHESFNERTPRSITNSANHTNRSVDVCTNDDDLSSLTEDQHQGYNRSLGLFVGLLPPGADGAPSIQDQERQPQETMPPSTSTTERDYQRREASLLKILEDNNRTIAIWKNAALTSERKLETALNAFRARDIELECMKRNLEVATYLHMEKQSKEEECAGLKNALAARDRELTELRDRLYLIRTCGKLLPKEKILEIASLSTSAMHDNGSNQPSSAGDTATGNTKDNIMDDVTISHSEGDGNKVGGTTKTSCEIFYNAEGQPTTTGCKCKPATRNVILSCKTNELLLPQANPLAISLLAKKVSVGKIISLSTTEDNINSIDDSYSDEDEMGKIVYSLSNTARARQVEETMNTSAKIKAVREEMQIKQVDHCHDHRGVKIAQQFHAAVGQGELYNMKPSRGVQLASLGHSDVSDKSDHVLGKVNDAWKSCQREFS